MYYCIRTTHSVCANIVSVNQQEVISCVCKRFMLASEAFPKPNNWFQSYSLWKQSSFSCLEAERINLYTKLIYI